MVRLSSVASMALFVVHKVSGMIRLSLDNTDIFHMQLIKNFQVAVSQIADNQAIHAMPAIRETGIRGDAAQLHEAPIFQDDFVDGPVLLARIIGWAVSEVSPSAFACKWAEGRARPETVWFLLWEMEGMLADLLAIAAPGVTEPRGPRFRT